MVLHALVTAHSTAECIVTHIISMLFVATVAHCVCRQPIDNHKGIVSQYKRTFSNRSRMGILIFQSSAWAMRFCDVAITRSARAWPAGQALRLRSGAYFCEIDFLRIQKKQKGQSYIIYF